MSSLPPERPFVKTDLTETPQMVGVIDACRLVQAAQFVAVLVPTGSSADLIDVSAEAVLPSMRRRDYVWLSEVFGTVVVGRLPATGRGPVLGLTSPVTLPEWLVDTPPPPAPPAGT